MNPSEVSKRQKEDLFIEGRDTTLIRISYANAMLPLAWMLTAPTYGGSRYINIGDRYESVFSFYLPRIEPYNSENIRKVSELIIIDILSQEGIAFQNKDSGEEAYEEEVSELIRFNKTEKKAFRDAQRFIQGALLLFAWNLSFQPEYANSQWLLQQRLRLFRSRFRLLDENIRTNLGNAIDIALKNEKVPDDLLNTLSGGFVAINQEGIPLVIAPDNYMKHRVEAILHSIFRYTLEGLLSLIIETKYNETYHFENVRGTIIAEEEIIKILEADPSLQDWFNRYRKEQEEVANKIVEKRKRRIILHLIDLLVGRKDKQEAEIQRRIIQEDTDSRRQKLKTFLSQVGLDEENIRVAGYTPREFGHAYWALLEPRNDSLNRLKWWDQLKKLIKEIQEGKLPQEMFINFLKLRNPVWYAGEPVDLLGYESEDPY